MLMVYTFHMYIPYIQQDNTETSQLINHNWWWLLSISRSHRLNTINFQRFSFNNYCRWLLLSSVFWKGLMLIFTCVFPLIHSAQSLGYSCFSAPLSVGLSSVLCYHLSKLIVSSWDSNSNSKFWEWLAISQGSPSIPFCWSFSPLSVSRTSTIGPPVSSAP